MLKFNNLQKRICVTCEHYQGERHLVPRGTRRKSIEMRGAMSCRLEPKMHCFPKHLLEWGVSCVNYARWSELEG